MGSKLYWCVSILAFSLCRGGITNAPADIDACVGEDVNIPWTYDDNDASISSVIWSNGANIDVMTYFGSGGSHTATNSYNVVNHGNGNITLGNVPTTYTAAYKIRISAGQISEDIVEVTVCTASDGLTSSTSGQTITCDASDLGTPAATLTIRIDGVDQSSSSATVTDLNKVECCLSGCAVSCMNGGSSSATESCIVVHAGKDPCEITVWDIILLILVIIVAIALIIEIAYQLYEAKKHTDGDNHGDDHGDGDGLSTSAIVGIVIRILAAVGIIVNIIVCVVILEPTCSLSICAILGIVIGPIDVVAIIAVIVYVIIKKTGVCNGKVLPFGICGDADVAHGKVNDIENNSKDKKQNKTPPPTGSAHGRPIQDIPRFPGLSANLDRPTEPKPKNALEPLPKKKKKKKKAKKDAPDSQRTEDEQE